MDRTKFCGLPLVLALCLAAEAGAETYTVSNTADTGGGSLRQAILDANGHPNSPANTPDFIAFAIPGGGVKTISPTAALPAITDPLIIDGYTQAGSSPNTNATGALNTVLMIELNGTSAGDTTGLVITAGGSTIRGLAINRFNRQGIELHPPGGNVMEGNFVGTDVTGSTVRQNGFSGFYVASPNNVIGGTTPAARNLSSGNFFHGVEISVASATGNQVQGNLLGTNAAGTASLTGTDSFGVFITNGANNNVIGGTAPGAGNVVSGNANSGIDVRNSSGNRIEGNYCGTTADGTAALSNGGSGVTIEENSSNNIVGGTAAGARNLLSGNNRGLTITGATGNFVRGNFIGTNAAGTTAIPNRLQGVRLRSGAASNKIGGTDAGEGNVISGNSSDGIWITNATTQNNQISQNLIGRNAANDGPLGNGGHGIFLESSGPNTIGGGFNPDNANVIAHNGGDGVAVVFGTGPCIRKGIKSNSIFSNGGLGIDLGDDGVTQNDLGDADLGANKLQNFPLLTSATPVSGNVALEGSLNSEPNTDYEIEFFSSEAADPSTYGEGQTFLGSVQVTSDNNGNATINAVLPAPPAGQSLITATATAPNLDDGNTSEFSQAIRLTGSAGRLLNIATRLRVQTGENVLIGGLIITGTDPKKVIIRGIGPSLAQFFSGALTNPTLELYQGNTLLQSNDDWKQTQRAEIEATGIQPGNDFESAIVRTLAPGNYTAIVRGSGDSTGIGLVEVYDLDQAANSELANIATRGFVEADDNVMIGGFIAGGGGGGAVKVVVRAIGPTLLNAGITGALQDPTLELRDVNGVLIAANDNWKQTQQTELQATGIPPNNDKESAILAILAPGNYTAIVRGQGNTTGVGLVEIYNVE